MENNNIKKEKKKKPIILILSITLILIIIIGGTYAWFVNTKNRTTKFTLGEIKHEIVENFKQTGPAEDVLPGDIINRDVWIHNLGKSDALLRVKIRPVWKDDKGNATEITNNDVALVFPKNLATNWHKGTDGYYYFKKILKSHNTTQTHPSENNITETTIPSCYSNQILDAISLDKDITDQAAFAKKNFDVIVISETIQVNDAAHKSQWNTSADKTLEGILINLVNQYKIDKEKTHS